MNKDLIDYFDELSSIWDDAVVHDKGRVRKYISLAEISEGDKVLDVGSGTGVLIDYIRERDLSGEITELDISKLMLNIARAKNYHIANVHYLNADIETYREEVRYDVVFLYNVLPYLRDKLSSLKFIYQNNLNEGGRILVAHSMGADAINNMLSKGDIRVCSCFLPPFDNYVKECIKTGMNIGYSNVSADEYTILFKK